MFWAFLLGVCAYLAVRMFLFSFLEDQIRRKAQESGIEIHSLSIVQLTPWQMLLRNVKIGPSGELHLPVVSIGYSPKGILTGTLKNITIIGPVMTAQVQDEAVYIPGLPLIKRTGSTGFGNLADLFHRIPMISVQSGTLHLQVEDTHFSLPFDLFLEYPETNTLAIHGSLHLPDSRAALSGTIDPSTGSGELNVQGTHIPLESVSPVLNPDIDLEIRGRLDFSANLRMETWLLTGGSFQGSIPDLWIQQGDRFLQTTMALSGNLEKRLIPSSILADGKIQNLQVPGFVIQAPISFTARGNLNGTLALSLSSVHIHSPLSARVLAPRAEVRFHEDRTEFTLDCKVNIDKGPLELSDLHILPPISTNLSMKGTMGPDHLQWDWNFDLDQPLQLTNGSRYFRAKRVQVTMKGAGESNTLNAQFNADLYNLEMGDRSFQGDISHLNLKGKARGSVPDSPDVEAVLTAPGAVVTIGNRRVEARNREMVLTLNLKHSANPAVSTMNFVSRDLDILSGEDHFTADSLIVTAEGKGKAVFPSSYLGRILLDNGQLNSSSGNLQARGISFDLPVSSHSLDTGGSLHADSVSLEGISMEDVAGTASIEGTSLAFTAEARLPVKKLHLRGEGLADLSDLRPNINARFEIPETNLSVPTPLGALTPMAKGMNGQGTISLSGTLMSRNTGAIQSRATLTLTDFRVDQADVKMTLSGVNTVIEFSDFLSFTTLPSQKLTFSSLTRGSVTATDGKIMYALSGQDSIFVEKAYLRFCGGSIRTDAFRLAPDLSEKRILAFLDRVELTGLINLAMGKLLATGEGTVSGMIPVTLTKRGLSIEDAYLYSVPGQRGIIRIPEGGQLVGDVVLAEEAIKDFGYDWARITLNSLGDRLTMKVELDGKPNQKLPLKLDPKSKELVRDPSGERAVELQGLSLDLNFVDIDVNELLREKGLMDRQSSSR